MKINKIHAQIQEKHRKSIKINKNPCETTKNHEKYRKSMKIDENPEKNP